MSNFKVGDTIWVRATAGRTAGDRIQIWFSGHVALFIPASECLPAEPPAVPDLSTMGVEVVSDLSGHRVKRPLELVEWRTPTLEDLKNGPIKCQYRDSTAHDWHFGTLVYVLESDAPYLVIDRSNAYSQWYQCRISESTTSCSTPTGSEMNAKTKQCIIDYCMDKINARAEIGYSDWWTRESHIVNSKHIVAVLEHFKDKGYETELASDDVTISW